MSKRKEREEKELSKIEKRSLVKLVNAVQRHGKNEKEIVRRLCRIEEILGIDPVNTKYEDARTRLP